MNALVGAVVLCLAAWGLVDLIRRAARVAMRLERYIATTLRRMWTAAVSAWRARSAARERRAVKRRESMGALQAETAHELAQLLADMWRANAALHEAIDEKSVHITIPRGNWPRA